MPRKQLIIGGTSVLAGLFYLCCYGDQWRQLLSHGSNTQSALNKFLFERENNGMSEEDHKTDYFSHRNFFVDRKAKVRSENRVVGGTPAAKGDYPFYAKAIGKYFCGATLIWEDILLSAAHCQGLFLPGGAAIGGIRLNNSDATIFEVESEYIHPKYNDWTLANDIMLIKLKGQSTAPTVSLNAKQGIPAIGDEVNTIGFGYTNETSYKPSNVLRQVKLDIFNDYICSLVYFIYRPRTMICAGTVKGGRGNCYGDSGGPLLTSDGVQVGIVSFGYGCANPSIPTGYTDVRPFLKNWIQPMICELSKNPPSYC